MRCSGFLSQRAQRFFGDIVRRFGTAKNAKVFGGCYSSRRSRVERRGSTSLVAATQWLATVRVKALSCFFAAQRQGGVQKRCREPRTTRLLPPHSKFSHLLERFLGLPKTPRCPCFSCQKKKPETKGSVRISLLQDTLLRARTPAPDSLLSFSPETYNLRTPLSPTDYARLPINKEKKVDMIH